MRKKKSNMDDIIEELLKNPPTVPTEKMKQLEIDVAETYRKTTVTMEFSNQTLKRLKDDETFSWTNDRAKFLANICVQLDRSGDQLVLEWMIASYLGMSFAKNTYPMFVEIFDKLVENKNTYVNKFEHFKGYAYYIPCKGKRVLVMTNENNDFDWLVIQESNSIRDDVFVRKIWPKSKKYYGHLEQPTLQFYRSFNFELTQYPEKGTPGYQLVYGDCRDLGHVMSYTSQFGEDKCDQGSGFLTENLRWFFEVGCVHCEVMESS